jgi:stage II sporulation protein GA (sporulation sigma-E factor processing peptidase)
MKKKRREGVRRVQGEVYADLYFLINMGMDLVGLMITAALMHRKTGKWRLVLAAALGGGYALAALLLGLSGWTSLVADLLAALLLCCVAFAERRRGCRVLAVGGVYLLVSMILGGVMTALYGWLDRLHLPVEALEGDGLSVWIFSALAAFAGLVTAKGGRFFGRAKRTRTVEISACLFGREISFTALVDTGNLLCDPVSGRGVIVVEERVLRGILPEAFFSGTSEEVRTSWMREGKNAARVRPIPAGTAAGERLLWAAIPERLEIATEKERFCADYLIAPARLGRVSETAVALIGWD